MSIDALLVRLDNACERLVTRGEWHKATVIRLVWRTVMFNRHFC